MSYRLPLRGRTSAAHAAVSTLILLVLSILHPGPLDAAEPVLFNAPFRVDQWKTEQGLPQNTIQCLLQTRDGYLWIGTRFGLLRYDGVQFTTFDHATTTAMVSDNCLCLAEDDTGCLWVGTVDGLLCRRNRTWSRLTTRDGLCDNRVDSLLASRHGGLWIGTRGGLNHLHNGTMKSHLPRTPHLASPVSFPCHNEVEHLAEGQSGRVWFSNGGGVQCFDPNTSNFTVVARQGLVHAVAFDSEGGLWWSDADNLHHLPTEQDTIWTTLTPGKNNPVGFIYPAPDGTLWVKTVRDGLARLVDNQFKPVPRLEYVNEQNLLCMLQDREGNLWLGSDFGGLFRFQQRRIHTYTTRDGLAGNNVSSLCLAPDGSVWLATDKGISQHRGGQFTNFAATAHEAYRRKARIVFADRQGEIWGATSSSLEGLSRFVFPEGEFVRVPLGLGKPINVSTVYEDLTGTLWVGTDRGLCRRSGDSWDWVDDSTINARAMMQDRADRLWIGTVGQGLLCRESGRLRAFTEKDGLPSNNVWVIHEDKSGALWLGGDHGLTRFKDGQFCTLGTRQGLFDNLINHLLEDEEGRFWLSCNRGIFCVRKADLDAVADQKTNFVTCVVYGEADGMESSETNGEAQPAGAKDHSGRLWFPTIKGVVVVDPRAMQDNTNPPPVVIEKVLANEKTAFGDCLHSESAIGHSLPGASPGLLRFPPGSARVLEIRYTANSFAAPDKVRFRCRLEGYDTHWRDMERTRVTSYTNLKPGDYQFRVIACNNHGLWNETGDSIRFVIEPFFHQTRAFIVLAATLTILAALAIHRLRVRFLARLERLERQHALELERARIARNMHDDLGSSLTHIALLGELAARQPAQVPEVKSELQKITDAARDVFRRLDEMVWAVNPKHDTVAGLADFLCRYMEHFLRPTQIRSRFEIPDQLPPLALTSETRHELFLVIKEGLNNVIKHAQATEVQLRLAVERNRVEIVLTDNGRGFDLSGLSDAGKRSSAPVTAGQTSTATVLGRASSGHGLPNMRARVEGVGGTLELGSKPGAGTRLVIHLAVNA